MCGAFGLTAGANELGKRFQIASRIPDLKPRYNIRPTQTVPIVVSHSPNSISMMRWGLLPEWAKDESYGYKTINARVETVATLASYRKSFRMSRCIVPMTFFWEWTGEKGNKTPHYIFLKDQRVFGVAGLYSEWKSPSGESVPTFSLITMPPNEYVVTIHDRMPAILHKEDEARYLDPDLVEPEHILPLLAKPYAAEAFDFYVTSRAVNSPKNDDVELITPVFPDEKGGTHD